jgi:DNA polymerase-3 subunit gamma/tau
MPSGGPQAALAPQPEADLSYLPTFQSVVALIEDARDMVLQVQVKNCLRLVSYAPGRIEFQPTEDAPPDLSQRLGKLLKGLTGARWVISLANTGGAPTIAEQDQAERRAMEAKVLDHDLMKAVLAAFPEARITDIRTRESLEAQAEVDALEALPDEDDWDPFEDD